MPEPKETKSLTVEEMWSSEKSLAFIKSQVAPTLTQQEWNLFVGIGINTQTNPLLREIWAVKYGNKCSIFIGRDGYRKSAQRNKNYDHHSADAVFSNDVFKMVNGEPLHEYALKDRGQLIGAYAICKRKGSSKPNFIYVELKEYSTKRANWASMPATMIKKCFDDKTKILTPNGFKLFCKLSKKDLVAQVDENRKISFVKPEIIKNKSGNYDMIASSNTKNDMVITENHDVAILDGKRIKKIEAKKIFSDIRQRKPFVIPRTAEIRSAENTYWSDDELKLLGYYLADGYNHGGGQIAISVSRKRKLKSLGGLPFDINKNEVKGTFLRGKMTKPRIRFLYKTALSKKILSVLGEKKKILNFDFSARQLKIILLSWADFDGIKYHKQVGIYTSNLNHKTMIELLGVLAGFSVNVVYRRFSDISTKPNYFIALNRISDVDLHKYATKKVKYTGKTYCVKVPTGLILVQREGYSFISGNCAEAQVLRQTFQELFSGTYDESEQGVIEGKAQSSPESVPEISLLLNDISKIDSLEKLNKLQTDDLPNWANNYSSEDLDKVAEVMKTRREELGKGGEAEASVSLEQPECAEPKPPTEKTVTEGMLEDSGLAEKEPKTPITDIVEGKKTPKKKTVKKEVKLKVEETTEKKSLDEAADGLFDDEKITKEDAEKFKKFFELKELDPAPWLGRCTVSHFHELTVEGAKELKRLIKMEIQ